MIPWFRIGAGVAALLAIGAFYLHYQNLVATRDELKAEQVRLEADLASSQQSVELALIRLNDMSASIAQQQTRLNALSAQQVEASTQIRRINDVFSQHDFQGLLNRKPGLVVPRVNSGTADTFRMFECTTAVDGCN